MASAQPMLSGIVTRTAYGRSGGCDAPTRDDRLDAFRLRLKTFLRGDDDALLERQARGIYAHRDLVRRMQEAQARRDGIPPSRALVPVGPLRVSYLGPPRRSPQRSLTFTRAT